MDTALENGDFYTNDRKHLVTLYDNEELLQRAIIRLCVKKGSFIYDKELGSKLYTLSHNANDVKAEVLSYAREALLDMDSVTVNDVEVNFINDNLNLSLNFIFTINNEEFEKTVVI